jgi:hypothetical protein
MRMIHKEDLKPMVVRNLPNLNEPGFKGVIEHVGSDYLYQEVEGIIGNPILIQPFQY